MLHAFELNQLPPGRQEQFEVHLLSCDYCFEQVRTFDNVASLLRNDKDVRELVASAVAAEEPTRSFGQRLRDLLWPDNVVFKPALSYLLILLLAFPAYIGIRSMQGTPVTESRSLLLTGTRGGADQVVSTAQTAVVLFRIDGAQAGQSYRVTVESASGALVYENDRFSAFNERELGTLVFEPGRLAAGEYTIRVFAAGQDTPLHEYRFSAE